MRILWNWLVKMGIATEYELRLITRINGYNLKSLNDVLFVRTGYQSREQFENAK